MPQTPLLGALAIPPVPVTATSIGYDPTTSGSPADNIQAELDRLESLITAIPSAVFQTINYGGQEGIDADAAAGATQTIDCSLGNVFDFTLTANCVLSIINPPSAGVAGRIIVILRQGGSGSYTVTWPAAVKWQSATGTNTGSAPTLWTAVGAQDVVELSTEDGGTTWGGYLTPHPSSGFTAGGDLTGTSTSQTVAKINGSPLGTLTPATADRLRWNGSAWVNSALVWTGLTVYDGTNWLPLVDGSGNAIMAEV